MLNLTWFAVLLTRFKLLCMSFLILYSLCRNFQTLRVIQSFQEMKVQNVTN